MTLIAVVGDDTTTTTIALAAGWTGDGRVLVVEADPTGGDLAAWLDLPRSPGLAELTAVREGGGIDALDRAVQRSAAGLQVLVSPVREVEAAAVVRAATVHVLPALAAVTDIVALVDAGAVGRSVDLMQLADAVVLVHRQVTASAAAAAVRLERLRDTVAALAADHRVVVAIRGGRPYPHHEIEAFLGQQVVEIADDPYGAAVLAGRPSSPRRIAASPLLRSGRRVAATIEATLVEQREVCS